METRYLVSNRQVAEHALALSQFENPMIIEMAWTNNDVQKIYQKIAETIKKDTKQIIVYGFEMNYSLIFELLKKNFNHIAIKVISNQYETQLYYDYWRNCFYEMFDAQKKGLIDLIGFYKKGSAKLYASLGYNTMYIPQNIDNKYLPSRVEQTNSIKTSDKPIGVFHLDYAWYRNIFNQLSVSKMTENKKVLTYKLDNRIEDFLATFKYNYELVTPKFSIEEIAKDIMKCEYVISTSFSESVTPIFFISMALGIPCVLGNTTELFTNEDSLRRSLVVDSEDNPVKIKKIIDSFSDFKDTLNRYDLWKAEYDLDCKKQMTTFLEWGIK